MLMSGRFGNVFCGSKCIENRNLVPVKVGDIQNERLAWILVYESQLRDGSCGRDGDSRGRFNRAGPRDSMPGSEGPWHSDWPCHSGDDAQSIPICWAMRR